MSLGGGYGAGGWPPQHHGDQPPYEPGQPRQRRVGGQHRKPRGRGRRTGLIVALGGGGLVALGVVAALVFVFVFGGSGADYAEAWTVSKEEKQDEMLYDAYVAGDVLVRATSAGVTGYGLGDGEQKWSFRPPSGHQLCTISPEAPRDVAVVAYGERGCTEAAAVDTSSGERVWRAPLEKGSDEQAPESAAAAIVQDVAVVSNGRVTAYDLDSGERRWTTAPPDTKQCRSGDTMASGEVLLAMADCRPRDESGLDDTLVSIDPAEGTVVWRATVKNEKGQRPPHLINVSPPVLYLSAEERTDEYGVVDDEGENPRVFDTERTATAGDRPVSRNMHARYEVAVLGRTLVELGARSVGSGSTAFGFDLAAGEQKWQRRLAGNGSAASLVFDDAAAKNATAYTVDAEGVERLVTIDPKDGSTRERAVVRTSSGSDGGASARVDTGYFLTSGPTVVEVGSGKGGFTARAYTRG